MKRFHYFSTYILLLITSSCETWDYYTLDEFNFEGTDHSIKMYVLGGITTQNTYHRIALYKPSDYLTGTSSENIVSAKVFITHRNDTMFFEPVTSVWDEYYEDTILLDAPYYQGKEKFGAIVGEVYTLNIEYEGVQYYGSDSVVEASDFDIRKIPLPRINYVPNETLDGQQPPYNFEFNTHHFGYPVSNQWIWYIKETFIDIEDVLNSSSYGATMYSHQFADAQGLFSNIEYSTILSYEHSNEEDTFMVVRVSLSDGYYKYLNQKFMETYWKEGVFASQPGNLSTNMSTGAMGYFFASDLYIKEILASTLFRQ